MDLSSSLENLLVNLEQEMGSAAAMSAADKVSVLSTSIHYKYTLSIRSVCTLSTSIHC